MPKELSKQISAKLKLTKNFLKSMTEENSLFYIKQKQICVPIKEYLLEILRKCRQEKSY